MLNPYQRKFSYKLAERVLSEYTSDEFEDQEDFDVKDYDPSGGVIQALLPDKNSFYLDEVLQDRSA